MSTEGKVRTETHERIFKIIIDNPAKKNAFSPAMMEQLSDALTELHNNDSLLGRRHLRRGQGFHRRPRHAEILRPQRRETKLQRRQCRCIRPAEAMQEADRHRRARRRLHHRHRTDAGRRHRRRRR